MHRFRNQEIAKILSEIAIYLEMDDVPFKPRAFEKVAEVIAGLGEEVSVIYARDGLGGVEKIPGVGKGIALRLEELLTIGKIQDYEKLKKKMPIDVAGLTAIEGVGPKHIKTLYKKLGIKTVAELEKAARAGKIRDLSGFGKKSEENILKGIEFQKKSGGRFILGFIVPEVYEICDRLAKLKEVQKIDIAGSIRRGQETVGDADILISSGKPKPVMDFFVTMPEVERVLAHGETKSSIKLKNGLEVDLRVIPKESYGAALNYFTGSKDHNVALRELAIKKGWKLSEYGLFSTSRGENANLRGQKNQRGLTLTKERMIAGKTEEEIYKKLGLTYIPSELREMTGEIEAARSGVLPHLVEPGDLKGDLQVQTNWTDGKNSIAEMANAAEKAGLRYIAVTDHTKRLAMVHGLDEKRLELQWKEIDHINKQFQVRGSELKILKGSECDILPDGSLDLADKTLAKLDVVGISVHSKFNMSRHDQTERIKKAMSNQHADILFHPTGRILQEREPYDIDMDSIIAHAKKTGTIMEIDAYPSRSDLKAEHIRKCVKAGVKMSIDSDAHAVPHFEFLKFGVIQARRGWASKSDIVNTKPSHEMLKSLKR